jgi:hypothetical protein
MRPAKPLRSRIVLTGTLTLMLCLGYVAQSSTSGAFELRGVAVEDDPDSPLTAFVNGAVVGAAGVDLYPSVGGSSNSVELKLTGSTSDQVPVATNGATVQNGKIGFFASGPAGSAGQTRTLAFIAEAQAFARVSAMIYDPDYNPSANPISATTTVSFANLNPTASVAATYTNQGPSQSSGMQRKLFLRSVTLDANGTAYVEFAFTLRVEGSVYKAQNIPYSSVEATGFVRLAQVYASTPDPDGIPDPPDPFVDAPENEYVMSGIDRQPFTVPCYMAVNGGDAGTLAYLQAEDRVNWVMTAPLPGALPRVQPNGYAVWTNPPAGHLFPQFQSDGPNDPPGTVLPGLGFSTRNGLPPSNADFGPRNIFHYLNGSLFDQSAIEIFYASTLSTHPPGGPKGWAHFGNLHLTEIPTPNWVYYYDQAWQNRWGFTINYTNEDESYFEPYQSNHLHIGNNAHGWRESHLFARQPGAQFLSEEGTEESQGIDTYARVVTHECVHKWVFDRYYLVVGPVIMLVPGVQNSDGDRVPDELEVQVWLNPNVNDTTLFTANNPQYGYSPDEGDGEVFARLYEVGLQGPLDADWADDGLNYGRVRPNRGDRSPRFPNPLPPNLQWPTLPALP